MKNDVRITISPSLVRDMVISELRYIGKDTQLKINKNASFHPTVCTIFTTGIDRLISIVSIASTFGELDTAVALIWGMPLQKWLDSVPWMRSGR